MNNKNDLIDLVIERLREAHSNIKDLMESLLYKITTSGWHDNPNDSLNKPRAIEDEYNCFQSIKIVPKQNEIEIILIGAIGYFN